MVPERLKTARLAARLTQEKLAELVDIDEGVSSRSRIANYESGRFSPTFDFIVRVAKALNYPTAYFYTEEDDFAERILFLHRNRHDPNYNPYSQSLDLAIKVSDLEKKLAEAKELTAMLSKCLNKSV